MLVLLAEAYRIKFGAVFQLAYSVEQIINSIKERLGMWLEFCAVFFCIKYENIANFRLYAQQADL